METTLTFAELLDDALHAKNMRKADLAKQLKIGKSTITKWCNGSAEPHFSQLSRLAQILDIDFNHYFGIRMEKIPLGKSKELLKEFDCMDKDAQQSILNICKIINGNSIL